MNGVICTCISTMMLDSMISDLVIRCIVPFAASEIRECSTGHSMQRLAPEK